MPREGGASSTPRLLGSITIASAYWIARSSRAMTASVWLACARFCIDAAGLLRFARNDRKVEETPMSQAKRIVLAARPVGEPKPSDFRIEEFAVPTPGAGEVLLRTIWLSLDPYMRGRMSDGPSYATPVPVGGVMEAGTVCEVAASNNAGFAKGDIVLSRAGWQTHAISDGKGLAKVDPKLAPISTAVGVLGMPGMTAYTGLLDIGKPQAGETVVVAGASGAVGSAVGQVAKIKGARAVGIAGGKDSIIAILIWRPS
jgi:NADPH-dependent curcumin reductase CurA